MAIEQAKIRNRVKATAIYSRLARRACARSSGAHVAVGHVKIACILEGVLAIKNGESGTGMTGKVIVAQLPAVLG